MDIKQFILPIAIYIIGLLVVLRWIYLDAKSRSYNPWIWILITAFISPNFIGLILYFLFRNKEATEACSKCGKPISIYVNYCSYCGTSRSQIERNDFSQPSYKSLIVGIVIITISFLNIFFILFQVSDKPNFPNSRTGIGISSSNADSLLITFSANNTTDTIRGFSSGENYRVKAIAEKAKGRFDIKME